MVLIFFGEKVKLFVKMREERVGRGFEERGKLDEFRKRVRGEFEGISEYRRFSC